MADKLKEIPAKILEWWNKFTTRQKSIIVGAAAVVIFAFAIIMYVMSKPQYVRLITCETTSQASEIIDTLDSAGIAHKESNDGLKIDVESSQQSAANLALGSAGYVPDALDLNDYLGGSMSTTATDKERLYNSYLEKYITQTIEAQSAVKSAKVHLSFPKDNGTLAAQKEEASAFIQLELDGTFTSANAAALAKCVATWLRNDTTANITIMDTDSNLLFAGGDDYSTAGIANSMQELQNQAESMIANQVKKVLLGTKQYNDAAVTSHLSMDFSDYKETVKEYYANSGRDEGMLSHEETYESENTNDGGGVPGTTSNGESGNTTYVSPDSSNSSSSTSETSRDYLPNESIKDTVTPAGGINYTNSSISIAAITYKEIHYEDVKRQGLLDGTTWDEYKSQNSADTKMTVDQDMYSLVANATGINESNITIIAYESPIFYDKESSPVTAQNVLSVLMLLLILGLLAFVILHSMRTRQAVQQEEEVSVENMLQSTPEAELEDIDVESKSETRKMIEKQAEQEDLEDIGYNEKSEIRVLIEKFVDENPESAAALLRNWLNEDWN